MNNRSTSLISTNTATWISATTAAIYPWILDAFHRFVTPSPSTNPGIQLSAGSIPFASLLLAAAFAVSLINLMIASRPMQGPMVTSVDIRSRRFTLFAVTAPTVYVFFGVLSYMAGSKVPDAWIWTPVWLLFGYLASRNTVEAVPRPARLSTRLRVVHGVSGVLVTVYVLFHLFNHLFGLISPESHASVMNIGRAVYRKNLIEPLLIAAMLFQVFSGIRLVWTWSERSIDRYRMFQMVSGVFMSIFILGHMNSVFLYARTWMNIPTDWAFATGLPTGLIHDAWNIRLLPHYALGVFFVLTHLFSGLRVVMLAHGTNSSIVNRIWWVGGLLSLLISTAIMCGMTGLRVA